MTSFRPTSALEYEQFERHVAMVQEAREMYRRASERQQQQQDERQAAFLEQREHEAEERRQRAEATRRYLERDDERRGRALQAAKLPGTSVSSQEIENMDMTEYRRRRQTGDIR